MMRNMDAFGRKNAFARRRTEKCIGANAPWKFSNYSHRNGLFRGGFIENRDWEVNRQLFGRKKTGIPNTIWKFPKSDHFKALEPICKSPKTATLYEESPSRSIIL